MIGAASSEQYHRTATKDDEMNSNARKHTWEPDNHE